MISDSPTRTCPAGVCGSSAIVIFGAAVRPGGEPSGTMRRRVQAAVRFGSAQADALYVPTGGIGRYGPSEASLMAGLLRELGVPAARLLPEETGQDTLSSVLAVAALLRARGHAGPVYAATSAYHLPRCVLLLRLAGVAAHACPPPPGPASRDFRERWYWRLREVPALPWDVALMLAARLRRRDA